MGKERGQMARTKSERTQSAQRRFPWLVVVGLILWATVGAQAGSRWLGVSGSLGTYGEVYHMQGREGRRDPATGRLFFRPTVTALGMTFPFEVVVSTEETQFRQSYNRLGIDPHWRWITLHLGDFYPRLNYFVSGVRVRGAGVDLRPGIFRLSVFKGQSRRSVPGEAFRRNMWAAQVGIGRENGNLLEVGVLKAEDDTTSSVSSAVTPQENLLFVGRLGISLFRRRLTLLVEGAGSLHTRDLRSPSADSLIREQLPQGMNKAYDLLTRYFTPRVSSRADYAYRVMFGFRSRRASLRAQYNRLGPGFVSLAMPYAVNDRVNLNLSGTVHIIRGRLSLRSRFTRYRDNLQKEKTTTNGRQFWTTTLQAKPWRSTSVNLSVGLGTQIREDSMRVVFQGQRYNGGLTQRLQLFGRRHTVRLSHTEQRSERWQGEYDVSNTTVRWDVEWWRDFVAGISVGTANNEFRGQKVQVGIFGFSARHRLPRKRITNHLNVGVRRGKGYTSVVSRVGVRWSLTRADALSLMFRRTDYLRGTATYHEMLGSVTLDHRFSL